MVVSGTHGVEGYCGSALQSRWLESCVADRPHEFAVVCLHGLNPYGFSWVRRTNEDNVDLNRNFIDWDRPPPANPGYDEIADLLVPREWTDAGAGVHRRPAARDARRAWVGELPADDQRRAVQPGRRRVLRRRRSCVVPTPAPRLVRAASRWRSPGRGSSICTPGWDPGARASSSRARAALTQRHISGPASGGGRSRPWSAATASRRGCRATGSTWLPASPHRPRSRRRPSSSARSTPGACSRRCAAMPGCMPTATRPHPRRPTCAARSEPPSWTTTRPGSSLGARVFHQVIEQTFVALSE